MGTDRHLISDGSGFLQSRGDVKFQHNRLVQGKLLTIQPIFTKRFSGGQFCRPYLRVGDGGLNQIWEELDESL